MRCISLFTILLSLAGCSQRTSTVSQQFHYHDNGKAKPLVAVVPVYDKSAATMPWNLSKELTEAFHTKIAQTGRFYMTNDFDMLGLPSFASTEVNPFLDDIGWIAESDSGTEFIVFIELVEHHLTPSNSGKSFANMKLFQTYSLDMVMRVKVIDIRQKQPTVILQELIEDNYYIPWQFSSFDYQPGSWSKSAFALSPIGMAHNKMVKRVTAQVEEYILLAKMH